MCRELGAATMSSVQWPMMDDLHANLCGAPRTVLAEALAISVASQARVPAKIGMVPIAH